MNKIEVIKFLLAEVENEQKRFVDYEKASKEAQKFAKEREAAGERYWQAYYKRMNELYTVGRIPHKSVIEQNLRKIRLLSLELLKEVERYGRIL